MNPSKVSLTKLHVLLCVINENIGNYKLNNVEKYL